MWILSLKQKAKTLHNTMSDMTLIIDCINGLRFMWICWMPWRMCWLIFWTLAHVSHVYGIQHILINQFCWYNFYVHYYTMQCRPTLVLIGTSIQWLWSAYFLAIFSVWSTLTLSLPWFFVQIKQKNCKIMKCVHAATM